MAGILCSAAVIFLLVEVPLQVRSQIRFGRGLFAAVTHQSRYVVDERTGLKVYRPNWHFAGTDIEIRTNSRGLRSPEIPATREPHSVRIAVVGASTVMGAEAATNEDTFSAILERRLRKEFPGRLIEVINAGVEGYRLKDQRRILERLILPLRPDVVVAFTGVNDFRGYCEGPVASDSPEGGMHRQGLPVISTPDWLLSVRAARKIAAMLQFRPEPIAGARDPRAIDVRPYRQRLEELATTVLDARTALVLATNVKAYRPDQPADEQRRLAEMSRQAIPCFDVAGLNALYDLHNAEIEGVGRRMGIPVLALHELIPGGERYFAASLYLSHFSREGEQLVADTLFDFLMANKLITF